MGVEILASDDTIKLSGSANRIKATGQKPARIELGKFGDTGNPDVGEMLLTPLRTPSVDLNQPLVLEFTGSFAKSVEISFKK